MQEQWKPVREFEDVYEVSNLGRVRRTKRSKGATVGHILIPYPQHKGYLLVDLRDGDKVKTKALHRLVAEAFVPNPLGLPEVNHLGLLSDCRAKQLEWRSEAGNNLHRQQANPEGGVSFYKRIRKWIARYSPEPNKEVWIGTFKTKKKALEARKAAVATIPFVL